jgi:lipoprotein-releasing system ATP-binding protein
MYKSFPRPSGDLEILHDVNFVLGVGELCAVIGASGAGKSTLLHCLGTLDRPTRGEIRFGGRNVLELPPAELAQFRNETIGFVFQFHHLLPEFSALENVMLPALIGRISPREARRRALEMLEGVGMSHRLTHRPGELSGGEQQRVAIARALVMQPKLLLADEPTGNLDTRTSHEVHELLFRLNQQQQITMLLVTHNLELAGQSPRVIRMADGRLVDGGPGDGDAEPESES